ncbi:MAG: ABC transporter substrate-binding protein [Acidimicrobiia bacterium]|nr:ABC transporter substrate-binding protein [Acidimicrobiia bacterium]
MCVLAGALAACSSGGTKGPLKVGVMLPLTGANAVGYRQPLQWAVDAVNGAGGIDGRKLELVFADTAKQPAAKIADKFAHDHSIVAAIGPDNSEDALGAAATFVKAHKVIVTPSATSADLFRAFAADNPQFVWRPVESDIAQTRALLQLADEHGATSAALVTGRSAYGSTFFDWFGFLADEAGLKVTTTIRYDESSQSCDGPVAQALATNPDALIAAPDNVDQAECMALAWRQHQGSRPPIFFSDSAQSTRVDGTEGTAPAPDPNNFFTRAYTGNFGKPPPPYAANTYDSVLLIAYGLARSHGRAGAPLAQAIRDVTAGTGPTAGWDATGVGHALAAIKEGQQPTINGAVGPWRFDKTAGLELTASTYENWQVSGGQFSIAGLLPMTSEPSPAPTPERADRLAPTPTPIQLAPKTGTWALLVDASDGWDNYRHQADVLAQYQRLRANGVPPDHMVVVMANDIADNARNKPKGTVRYTVGGPNLDTGVRADYSPTKLTGGQLMDVLAGRANPQTPKVIDSGPGDNLYVYLAGHGNDSGLYLGLGQPVPSPTTQYSVLTPATLEDTIARMATQHRYRQLIVAIEACQSGAFGGEGFNAPGALLLTAAGPNEDSLSTNYDPTLRTWLADQFSYQLYRAEADPTTTLDQLYRNVYLNVAGAHVRAYGPNFGDPATVTVGSFLSP